MAGALRIRADDPSAVFTAAMKAKYRPVAKAATSAVRQVADSIKRDGRANILAAGFSRRFANTFAADAYPKGSTVSVNAAALVYDRVEYADIFETGGAIHGKPTLWLPLPTAPKRIGRQKVTPSLYIKNVGPLISIERPGKPPLLAGKAAFSTRGKNVGKVTLSALKRGAAGKASTLVPLFVGVPRVNIKQKFHLRAITAANAAKLGAYYVRNFIDR